MENFSECSFCDSLECCLRFLWNLIDRLKTATLQLNSYMGEQWSHNCQIRWIVGWGIDLALCNFGLFPNMKMKLKGCRAVLRLSKRFKRNRRQHSRLSQKLHSEKFSSPRKRDGTSAIQRRRTRLRLFDLKNFLLYQNFYNIFRPKKIFQTPNFVMYVFLVLENVLRH